MATSDGIFVFTGGAPTVTVGDALDVEATVGEFVPGGTATANLSVTQLSSADVTVLSSGNVVPAATVIGAAGRLPPTDLIISPDELPVNLRDEPGTFNADVDGIDFYESLDGMIVTVDAPSVIAATNGFGETWVVSDRGADTAPGLNDRGALPINSNVDGYGDLNPERIQLQYDSGLTPAGAPDLSVGDLLSDVTGVISYDFGNFQVNVTESVIVEEESPLAPEVTDLAGSDQRMTVATYNVLNLSHFDTEQLALLGEQIADNLAAPDVITLQEIQDDNGQPGDPGNLNWNDTDGDGFFDSNETAIDDGVVAADETLEALVAAIAAAGGPQYEFVSAAVDVWGSTGGIPGGNIRNAFICRADRVELLAVQTLDPAALAAYGVTEPNTFDGTRDPILGVFSFNGEAVTVIGNHFTSRSGSDPIFGAEQPFEQAGEAERAAECRAINEVVDAILADDPDARVMVAGDLNTFPFTDEVADLLSGTGSDKILTNLVDLVGEDDAYSFIFEGNAQALDQMLVTDSLLDGVEVDYVHVNVDFLESASDHEPVLASLLIPGDTVIVGGGGDDTLRGGSRSEIFDGLAGDDVILGRGGDDTIRGAANDDFIRGGAGADSIVGNTGDDSLFGGRDDDLLGGGIGNDFLSGGAGNDTLAGNSGDDTLQGGRGNGKLLGGDGDDVISGNRGDDFIRGGDGDDRINGGSGADRIFGDGGDDFIRGGRGPVFDFFGFAGSFGNDVIADFATGEVLRIFGASASAVTAAEDARGTLLTVDGIAADGTIRLRDVFGFDLDEVVFG